MPAGDLMPRKRRPASSAILAGVAQLAGMATHSDNGEVSPKPASSGNHPM